MKRLFPVLFGLLIFWQTPNSNTLANKSQNPFKEKVLINRVEYSDGSIWQRKDWSLSEVKASYDRVLREQWTPGMCRGL